MAHTDHLHTETKLLPVKYHSELLAKQYWLSCHQPHHPCHLSTESAPPRNMKGTPHKYNTEVVPFADEGINEIEIYLDCLRTLHTQAVTEAISNYTPNRVLGTPPPDISPLESLLPWSVGTHLLNSAWAIVHFWNRTWPASLLVYQMFVHSVEWHHTL